MDAQLRAQLDEVIEALRAEVHQQAESWSTIRTPSELFDFEQGLQAVLNRLQAGIVGAVLKAIHRDREFVYDCQHQARRQCGVLNAGWRDVWVLTLGGQHVHLKLHMQNSQRTPNKEVEASNNTDTERVSIQCYGG
jgi:hypothetical protein